MQKRPLDPADLPVDGDDEDPLALGGGGGSGEGGAGARWTPPDGTGALELEENGQQVYVFESALTNSLVLWVTIPSGYVPGTQINMDLGLYVAGTSLTVLMSAVTTLIREGGDAIGSVSNQHSSVNSAITLGSPSLRLEKVTIDLTDGSGEVNAVAVGSDDILKIELTRGVGTNSADIKFIPSSTQVRFS